MIVRMIVRMRPAPSLLLSCLLLAACRTEEATAPEDAGASAVTEAALTVATKLPGPGPGEARAPEHSEPSQEEPQQEEEETGPACGEGGPAWLGLERCAYEGR